MLTRRNVMAGSAAIAAFAASPALPASNVLKRGLWADEFGSFAIGLFPEFGPSLFAFDYAEMRVGKIVGSADQGWMMSGALNGVGSVAPIAQSGSGIKIGDRNLLPISINRRPFNVPSGSAVISAEIALPMRSRVRGTVLMIYGSGPAPKAAFDPWTFWFLANGFSVITYDKRGSGRSTGDWRLSGLEDLAKDASVVLKRARQLGVAGPIFSWGASQAGWVQPQLAASGLVNGTILHAGCVTTPAQQIVDSVESELQAYAFPAEEIERAKTYYALDRDVSRGLKPWAEIDEAFRMASSRGAEWLIAPPAAADAPERTMIRLMSDFDPTPYWRSCKGPVLALFGEKDWVVPVLKNRHHLEEAISSKSPLTVRTLKSANHLMFSAKTGVRTEYPQLSHIVPEYFSSISNWLGAQT